MCSGSPYGDYFPADVGANETDRNLLDTTEYGLNEYQKQVRLLVNGNVHSVMFYYSNFNTELNYDFLTVEDLLGEYSYTGNWAPAAGWSLNRPRSCASQGPRRNRRGRRTSSQEAPPA